MGQSLVSDSTGQNCMPQEIDRSLWFLPAALAEGRSDRPYVAFGSTQDELWRWVGDPLPGLQWIQVEGLLSDRKLGPPVTSTFHLNFSRMAAIPGIRSIR
jgi:hypothetical protein